MANQLLQNASYDAQTCIALAPAAGDPQNHDSYTAAQGILRTLWLQDLAAQDSCEG
jgi:hypothetical protein